MKSILSCLIRGNSELFLKSIKIEGKVSNILPRLLPSLFIFNKDIKVTINIINNIF